MCGRYALSRDIATLQLEFDLDDSAVAFLRAADPLVRTDADGRVADHNIAPTATALVVRERLVTPDEPDAPAALRREAAALRWGLVPAWAQDVRVGARMINARAETVHEKPAYRAAAAARRCLVPADGWFEWVPGPAGKRPHFMTDRDGALLALAGLWESRRDPADPERTLQTFTIITTAAEEALADVHDRMPVVLPRERWADWLDPRRRDLHGVRALLADLPAGRFAVREVSPLVNAVRAHGPECIAPLGR